MSVSRHSPQQLEATNANIRSQGQMHTGSKHLGKRTRMQDHTSIVSSVCRCWENMDTLSPMRSASSRICMVRMTLLLYSRWPMATGRHDNTGQYMLLPPASRDSTMQLFVAEHNSHTSLVALQEVVRPRQTVGPWNVPVVGIQRRESCAIHTERPCLLC